VFILHRFEILSLISQNLKRSSDTSHIPFAGNITHSTPLYQSGQEICPPPIWPPIISLKSAWLGAKIEKKRVTWPWPRHFEGWLISRSRAGTWYSLHLCAKFDHSRFSRSGDMIGAHLDLNGSRDLTTPFYGWFVVHGLALATINLATKFEVSIPPPITIIWKGIQNLENGVFRALGGHPRSLNAIR